MSRPEREIRATFDRETITVYQAFDAAIADAALKAGRFVAPFSFHRMTWIKPSFLWLMARSQWGQKRGQQRVLGVRIRRSGWEAALNEAVLTDPDVRVYAHPGVWQRELDRAKVHAQWDPERSLRGTKFAWRSVQVGISRHRIEQYVNEWIVEINDETPRVRKIHALLGRGRVKDARRLLPIERVYPTTAEIQKRLGM